MEYSRPSEATRLRSSFPTTTGTWGVQRRHRLAQHPPRAHRPRAPRPARATHRRTRSETLLSATPRTLGVLIAPYREPATVDDGAGAYRETFSPGCFRRQVEEAKTRPLRIWLTREHRGTVIGHAVRLHDLETALFGAFRVHEGDDGDEALAAIRAGTLTGISVTMTPLRSRDVDGVTRREQAWLTGVALVPTPAYTSARVTHIRHALSDELADPASPDELAEWERERLDAKLREIACAAIDANTRSFRSDARYQAACRLREELAEERRQLEPQVLRRGCGTILEIR